MVKPKTKSSKQKFLSQITKKPRKCDVKKERKLENQRIRKYQQFLDILNLTWSIVDSVSLEDHIHLAETMKDDYILLLRRRPSKKNILDDVLSNVDLNTLKETTLNLLSNSTWKYISLYALMDEKFIFKWSHKIDFLRLKINEKGCVYGGGAFDPHFTLQRRVFSKKFHKLFPGFQMYEPCERCYLDTQWLSKNIYIKDEQKWFCEDCFDEVCHYCLFEDCDGKCDDFGFDDYWSYDDWP